MESASWDDNDAVCSGAHAVEVVAAILHDLGLDDRGWLVLSVDEQIGPRRRSPREGVVGERILLLHVGLPTRRDSQYGVFLSEWAGPVVALTVVADQVAEHAIEHFHGEPLPPCPGHRHPLVAAVHADVGCWVCPLDPVHHRRPIGSGPWSD